MTAPVTDEIISSDNIPETDDVTFGSPIADDPSMAPSISVESLAEALPEILPITPSVLKPIPKSVKSPVGNYYTEIKWFTDWKVVRFATPMDGNCLFHAIANSFFPPYHTENLDGKPMSRKHIIASFRKELSQKLAKKISDAPNSPTYYDSLNRGTTASFAGAVPEFALSYMQEQLNSNFAIGYGYMEFIGNAINKDIYILEAARRDIYTTDELTLTITGTRKSIVLYYMNGHYESVGIEREDGTFDTHFSPDHSFIRFLYSRVQAILKKASES